MNLDSMNLLQRWVSDIFQAQRTFKGRDNKSAVRFFSYVHLTLVTLFFHFYSYSPTEGVITLPAMAHNFCVWGSKYRSHGLNAMWTIPVGTKSERLWNNIIQTNLNYSVILPFFFFFFPHNSRAKGKRKKCRCYLLDFARPLTQPPPPHPFLQIADGWMRIGWMVASSNGVVKGSMSQSTLVTSGVLQYSCL